MLRMLLLLMLMMMVLMMMMMMLMWLRARSRSRKMTIVMTVMSVLLRDEGVDPIDVHAHGPKPQTIEAKVEVRIRNINRGSAFVRILR